MEKRREEGVKERTEYLLEERTKSTENIRKLSKLLADNPKIKRQKLAEALGVSIYPIDQLKKELESL